MRKLIMWNLMTLDGYFEGAKNWNLPWHERLWGEELERFSVFGSAHLSKTLMNGGLFDEYRLDIAPVIHGNGRLLFSDGLKPQALELLETHPLSTGCVILRYRRTM